MRRVLPYEVLAAYRQTGLRVGSREFWGRSMFGEMETACPFAALIALRDPAARDGFIGGPDEFVIAGKVLGLSPQYVAGFCTTFDGYRSYDGTGAETPQEVREINWGMRDGWWSREIIQREVNLFGMILPEARILGIVAPRRRPRLLKFRAHTVWLRFLRWIRWES